MIKTGEDKCNYDTVGSTISIALINVSRAVTPVCIKHKHKASPFIFSQKQRYKAKLAFVVSDF